MAKLRMYVLYCTSLWRCSLRLRVYTRMYTDTASPGRTERGNTLNYLLVYVLGRDHSPWGFFKRGGNWEYKVSLKAEVCCAAVACKDIHKMFNFIYTYIINVNWYAIAALVSHSTHDLILILIHELQRYVKIFVMHQTNTTYAINSSDTRSICYHVTFKYINKSGGMVTSLFEPHMHLINTDNTKFRNCLVPCTWHSKNEQTNPSPETPEAWRGRSCCINYTKSVSLA